jgi:hypothetical protein
MVTVIHRGGVVLGAVVLLAQTGSLRAQPSGIATRYRYTNSVTPRLQWNANDGYCGETSFICAGMRFGQYCSQFTARSIASPGIDQSDPSSQLLLGVNDVSAAQKMRLKATEFPNATQPNTKSFLAWVKGRTLSGQIVIIGVFNNGPLLGEWTGPTAGDPQYDHIVPVLGFGSNYSFERFGSDFVASDVITISDNGLYGPVGQPPVYPFLFRYRLRNFPGTRQQANDPWGPVYMLRNRPKNFGIAIEGVADLDDVTIPVTLTSNANSEPELPNGSNVPPTPVPIQLTATVSRPDPGVAYNLYRYDDFDQVPEANFNAMAGNAVESWVLPPGPGTNTTFVINTLSDKTVIFRAVPASAP